MAARRFDTDALLEQLLTGDGNAFKAFYERYRGRVYRFITRQCGNGEEGQAVYLSVWAKLIDARLKCKSNKSLKFAFLTSLQKPSFKPLIKTSRITQLTLMPRELDEEGGWSTLLVDLIRRLPEGLRKRFLFRYEIGLSHKAIATIFHERSESTQGYVEEAERELMDGLRQAGYSKRVSLEALYRESRILKPPAIWDNEVLMAYPGWLKKGVPPLLLKELGSSGTQTRIETMKTFLHKRVGQIKSDLSIS